MDISITVGSPDETEIAALVLALAARPAPAATPAPRVPPWRDPARRLGVDRDWRSSRLPR